MSEAIRFATISLLAAGMSLAACRSQNTTAHSEAGDAGPPQHAPEARASGERPSELAATRSSADTLDAAPPAPPELTGDPLVELEVEGFRTAAVSVPLGSRGARPVVIALHGNYDRPEWQCSVWREITEGFPWVLCPRGIPRADAPKSLDRWTYGSAEAVRTELSAALQALANAYPEYVDAERPIFAGFSLGAILGVRLLSSGEGPSYRAAVLVEGGYNGWSSAAAEAFAARGGDSILFACGQSACVGASKQAARVLTRHEIRTEIASGGNIGHTYDGAVADAIRARYPWLTLGDPRFGGVSAH